MRITKIVDRMPKMAQASFGDSPDEFSNRIVPSISLSGDLMGKESWTDVMRVLPCDLKYLIDIEMRSWGVKGATVRLEGSPIIVEIEVRTESGPDANPKIVEETKKVAIDPSKMRVELSPGSSIVLNEIDLTLNPDFTVDYGSSEVRGTTMMGVSE